MSNQKPVRVRFAPSPTGPLHIGGVRTALYNYLFAQKNQGTFILRMEDTDQTRYVEGAEKYIRESLDWLGMTPDEGPLQGGAFGPYRQSERREIYQQYITHLIDNGTAYYAFDTPEELEAGRERMKEEGVHTPKYDHVMRKSMRNSLTLDESEVNRLLDEGAPYTIRLKVDPGHQVSFEDEVRGTITFDTSELDDKVLMKTDGLPTYHFANIVDDRTMQISHVIRGEEWLSSTPHHVLMYRAFGWEDKMPVFAHLPLILKPTGKGKLSKRDGAKFGFPVFPLDWQDADEQVPGFRECGFIPEALLNFLAFLGWNPGTDQEIFPGNTLAEAFTLDKINKSGARFDFDKAQWFNAQYIKEAPTEDIIDMIKESHGIPPVSHDVFEAVVDLYKDRVHTVSELVDCVALYEEGQEVDGSDSKLVRSKWNAEMSAHFEQLLNELEGTPWDSENLTQTLKGYISNQGLKFGDVFRLFRTALVGTDQGPDLVMMMLALGKEESIQRIRKSIGIFSEAISE